MLDCMIIGSGVAGISAALTLKANGRNFKLFGSKNLSEKIEKAELIRNYAGLSNVSGKAFVGSLKAQLNDMEIPITEEKVSGVYVLKDKFGVATQQGNYYEAKTVLLACGVEAIKPIDGEREFMGKGVSYCATCDGFLYKDKTIAVLCTSKRLEHEIDYLAKLAKEVYLVAMYKDVDLESENVKIIRKLPEKIMGERRVESLSFKTEPFNGAPCDLNVDGVFILRETFSPATLIEGLTMDEGHVRVNRKMQTNISGFYAAGDCTGRPYQYAKAAGEGNVAAHTILEFLKGNQ